MCATLTRDQVALVVAAACAAPSIHNSQPWQFSVAGDRLVLFADPDRALWVTDPTARALYISCGAALFNARVALRMLGLDPLVRPLPHPEYSFDVLAVIEAAGGTPPTPSERELYESVWRRHINRGPFSDTPVAPSVMARLQQAAHRENASLRVLDKPDATIVLALAEQAGNWQPTQPIRLSCAGGSRPDGRKAFLLTPCRCSRTALRRLSATPISLPLRQTGDRLGYTRDSPSSLCSRPMLTNLKTGCAPARLCSTSCLLRASAACLRRSSTI